MKLQFSYPFPSVISTDQDLIKLNLSLDKLAASCPSLSVIIKEPHSFISCFSMMCNSLLDVPGIKFKNTSIYDTWKDKEIINQLITKVGAAEEKPDFMKEVLEELDERRENLVGKFKRQLNHFEQNRKRIEDIRRKKHFFSQTYYGLHLSSTEKKLIFESLSYNGQNYIRLDLNDGFEFHDKNHFGNAFVEISSHLIEDINKLYLGQTKEADHGLTMNTNKIKGIFIQESDSRISVDVNKTWLSSFRTFTVSFFLLAGLFPAFKPFEIGFSRTELFDLLALVKQRYKSKKRLEITFKSLSTKMGGKRISYIPSGIEIYTSFNLQKKRTLQFYADTEILLSLYKILHQIQDIKFLVLSNNLPNFLEISSKNHKLTLGFTRPDTESIYCFNTLIESLKVNYNKEKEIMIQSLLRNEPIISFNRLEEITQNPDITSSIILSLIDQGKAIYDAEDKELSKRELVDATIFDEITKKKTKHIVAGEIAKIIQSHIERKIDGNIIKYSLHNFDFHPEITMKQERITSTDCTCEKNFRSSPCEHILGMYAAITLEVRD
ncbi:MAG: hypothetical protein ACXAD7_13130 [Candidatus Kariarchaeaceae archaeon]|jgi:hypothetical protein